MYFSFEIYFQLCLVLVGLMVLLIDSIKNKNLIIYRIGSG